MPKKKLTKAQVKKNIARIALLEGKLITDKIEHTDSFVPFSIPKMLERRNQFKNAIKRLK
tara:strand:+ start:388 stop:567 length:180 start_codon:yes stop_codon:yes gene_type:complete